VAVCERTRHLEDAAQVAEVDHDLAEVAGGLTRSQLCRRTTALVAKADPEGYERRCKKAREERRVEFSPLPDGMAKLMWILPAAEARELFQQLCADAKGLPVDERTTDQKRCDVLMERVLGQRTEWNVRTFVTVWMETLMRLNDEPGQLAGYGPIEAGVARELAMRGPWRGIVLDEYRRAAAISKNTYRPSRLMKEFGHVRSGGTCAAPGCTRPIEEHDHITPWPGGGTEAANLQGLCRRHHHAKHDNYSVTRDADGTAHWKTPLGRKYSTQAHQY
jgi:5-methylcytosine-specific restriction endonuclease McrA